MTRTRSVYALATLAVLAVAAIGDAREGDLVALPASSNYARADWSVNVGGHYGRPEVIKALQLIGEVWNLDPVRFANYLRPDELHTAFNLDFLCSPWDGEKLRSVARSEFKRCGRCGCAATAMTRTKMGAASSRRSRQRRRR